MQWESIGFKGDPFDTDPIMGQTLALYTGNHKKIAGCEFALQESDVLMVIEGPRGVGTTSFANYLRFSAEKAKTYFTPTNEIRLEPSWNTEALLAAVISNLVMELELHHTKFVKNKKKFIEAKAVVSRIAETYRSFGATMFGFGTNYGKTAGTTTQPMIMPSPMIAHHLEALVELIKGLGYHYGVLIQINNLDVGVVQDEKHLMSVLNIMRDYFQTSGVSWILVGDCGLRRFIAQHVDRLDDIICHETEITPLAEKDYLELINKRVEHFRLHKNIKLPIDKEVLLYLYKATKGRLRYIFGLLRRLFNTLQIGALTDKVSIDVAKPLVKSYAQTRIARFNLSPTEASILNVIVTQARIQVKEIAKHLGKPSNQISANLAKLLEYKLVGYQKEGQNRFYYASIDADIAYSDL